MALGNLTVRLGLDAADYLSGLSKAEAEAAKFAKQQERTSLAIDKQVKALQDQAATLGYSERQLKIVELAQRGATKAQLESANAALKQKEAFQEANKAIANAAAKAKATTDATAAIDKQVKALHDQVAVQGRSERQTKLYELTQQGATKAQLASADAALRQKAAFEATTKFMRDLGRAALYVGAALGGAAIAGAVLFEKLVGKAASFQDLAEKTGASAEALASFQVAASVTNTSMDTLANLSVKLTKGLAGTDEETKQAANAIKQLGLNVEDFRKLDPAAQFEVIGKRLNEFADGSGKTAFAVAAMGRAGADALPFLKELGAQGQRNVILTAAQIKAADDYKDAQARLRAEVVLYATRLAIDVLPVVQDFQKALFETAKQILGVSTEASKLAGNNDVEEFASKAARGLAVLLDGADLVVRGFQLVGAGIAGLLAQLDQLQRFDFKGLARVQAEARETANKIIDRPLPSSNLAAQQAASARERELANDSERRRLLGTVGAFRPKPELDPRKFGGGGGAKDAANKAAAEAKKLLDKQLSDLDNFIKAEDRILQSRETALSRHYQNDQLSIASYFDARRAALELNTQATVAAYDKQIKAAEDFADFARRTKNATALLEAQTKIGDVQEKRAEAQGKAAEVQARLDDERSRAAQAYADQVDELRAKVLELSNAEGTAAQAALIRFDIQNRALSKRATAEGDTGTLNNIGVLRQSEDSRTRINQLLKDAQVIEERLGTTEARLHLERDLGLRGELASLGELGKARAAALPEYQRIAAKLEELRAIAVSLGDQQSVAAIDRFNLKIQELAATTDVLADKFRNVFEDSFADAFASFIDGTTSAKDAFKAFADDVVRQINRMAAQEIAGSLFGKGSGSGGLLSSLIGLIASAFGGGGSTAASNFGMNVREKGGPVSGRTPYIVGERGPEIFVPRTVAAAANKQIDSLIAQKGKPAEYTDRVKAATVATNLPHLIGAKGPEIFVPKMDGIVIPNDKVNKLSRVLQGRADGGPVVSATPYIVGERGPEIFTPRNAAILGPQEKVVTRLVSIVQPKASQVALGGLKTHDESAGKLSAPLVAARTIMRAEKIITRYANAPRQRRAEGGPVAAHTPYVVGELGQELFVTKSAEKIIKNESRVSELVTNNARRNEKIINDLVSKTVHHREIAGSVAAPQSSIPFNLPRSGLAISSPNVAAKIIKNEIRISELVSNDVQRNEEIINRLATTTRREGGRSNLLIVGAHGPELFIPKADGSIIKNEQRINELVSNIEHRNIDRRSQKTIDEIISSTVQRRAKGGPVAAYQTHLRGAEKFSETNITNNHNVGGVSIPADFFTNDIYRRARGGAVVENQPYIVGERGPEWFVPKSAGTIIPSGKAGGMVMNIQFVLPPGGYTRATQDQIASDASRALNRARRIG